MLAKAPQLGVHRLATKRAPTRIDRSSIAFTPGMDDNNILNDCTAVSVANCARAAAALHGYSIDIPTTKVVGFYSQSTGYNGTPGTDLGGVIARVLQSQAQPGFDIGGQAPLIGAFGTFDPQDLNLMRVAMDEAGIVDLGVALSISDQNMEVWDTIAPASAGDPTPGSWGLHSLFGWDYTGLADDDTVRLGTWGGWQVATWRWVRARADEGHSIAWRQFGVAPSIDYDRLVADNDLFAGWLAA
jgi:hypothetical protein